MTPEEQAEEWGKALWERGVIDNFKKLDKKTRSEVRYYLVFALVEYIERCLQCPKLRNKSSLNVLCKNAMDIVDEFQEADEAEKEKK